MPRTRTPPPPDILQAITAHLAAAHGLDGVDLAEVGRPRSRSEALRVVWHDGEEWTQAWFCCRRCDRGFRRYLVDVDRDHPTRRMLRLIAGHFDASHPAFRGPEDLGTRAAARRDQLAYYTPPSAHDGASLICQMCKQVGRNPIMLTDPPYGDARRLRLVKRRHPELAARMLGWTTKDQANYLDALDRGLLAPSPAEARKALASSRQRVRREPTLYHQALLALLQTRTSTGEGITAVIDHLHDLSNSDQIAFTCQVAEGLIELGTLPDEPAPPTEVAEVVRRTLGLPIGRYPKASKATLNRVWKRREVEAATLPPRTADAAAPPERRF
jgi:hypothetical protein